MPEFPTKETDILALATQMVAGYKAHGPDFPNTSWITLKIKCVSYKLAKRFQNQIRSQIRLSTEAKNASLKQLAELMKNCLKRSEVDTSCSQEKLSLIGWAPKAAPQAIEAPSVPRNLIAKLQGKGTILLLWDSPSGGGNVRNYIIQRRGQRESNAEFGPWHIAGTALNNEIDLNGQPCGVQLEYRIRAANTGGESTASNTIAVVL